MSYSVSAESVILGILCLGLIALLSVAAINLDRFIESKIGISLAADIDRLGPDATETAILGAVLVIGISVSLACYWP
jgi:hypothetical protein